MDIIDLTKFSRYRFKILSLKTIANSWKLNDPDRTDSGSQLDKMLDKIQWSGFEAQGQEADVSDISLKIQIPVNTAIDYSLGEIS